MSLTGSQLSHPGVFKALLSVAAEKSGGALITDSHVPFPPLFGSMYVTLFLLNFLLKYFGIGFLFSV